MLYLKIRGIDKKSIIKNGKKIIENLTNIIGCIIFGVGA